MEEGVLWPWEPPLIEHDRLTVPELLSRHGYHTACIGKWHLGWDWPTSGSGPTQDDIKAGEYDEATAERFADAVDFGGKLSGGPVDCGFDYYFGDDVPNFPPYAWIKNDRILDAPTEEKPEEMFGFPGPMAPDWDLEAVMPELTRRAVEYVETAETPFFLYFPQTAPHTPIVPTERLRGRSDAGEYGDYICEADSAVGAVLDALERRGIADDTLVVFTSDNGPEHHPAVSAYRRIREHGHYSMDGLRGVKRNTWEGGHRVPFVARWPGEVPAGTMSAETICQTDFLATLAGILGVDLPADTGEDSYDVGSVLWGDTQESSIREATVHHGMEGELAIRRGDWVYIESRSGGTEEPDWFRDERGYTDDDYPGELYDLSEDPAQRHNRYGDRPEKVDNLRTLLTRYRERERSAPR